MNEVEKESKKSLPDWHREQKVAVYFRVPDSDSQGLSFDLQNKYYMEYFRKKPECTLVAMYRDVGYAGKDGLTQMLEDAHRGKFDTLVVRSISRLSRSIRKCIKIIKELKSIPRPVGIYFEMENFYSLDENADKIIELLILFEEESYRKA